jgi:hypothetical protein
MSYLAGYNLAYFAHKWSKMSQKRGDTAVRILTQQELWQPDEETRQDDDGQETLHNRQQWGVFSKDTSVDTMCASGRLYVEQKHHECAGAWLPGPGRRWLGKCGPTCGGKGAATHTKIYEYTLKKTTEGRIVK